ncbi:MAG: glutathione S-transferase family protein [Rhizobiaceae bacterium]|nr:glutathione S-transferase family protein [Rhizobiaceae bacterium]
MLTLWGRPNSGCTQRVLWSLEEAKVPYNLILASGIMGPEGHISTGAKPYGVVDTPEYLAMNPNGVVPTIKEGDFTLWESLAVVSYVALNHAPDLYGNDLSRFTRAVQWGAWSNQHFDPSMYVFVFHLVRLAEEQRDPVLVEEARKTFIKKLRILETELAKSDYLLGDTFSIADILVAPSVHRWFLFDLERPAMPVLEAWHARLAERPAFQKHIAPRELHLG